MENLYLLVAVLVVIAVVILIVKPWRTVDSSEEVAPKKVIKRVVKVERIAPPVIKAVDTVVTTDAVASGESLQPVIETVTPSSMTVAQLRELAKSKGITGYSSMNKTELLAKLSEVK